MAFPIGIGAGSLIGDLLGANNPNPPQTKGGKFLGFFTGRNRRTRMSANQQVGAEPVQNRPLASGSISFGSEQRNRNLLNVAGLAVLAFLGWAIFGRRGKRGKRR